MVLMLLEHGTDPNKMDGYGSALIQMMIADDNMAGAEMLLDHGADANHVDERSFHMVLAEAIDSDDPGMVRLLLRHGARIGVIGRYNETALELARKLPKTSKHRIDLIRLLEAYAKNEARTRKPAR